MKRYKVDLKQILKESANWEHSNFGIVANFISGLGEDGVIETYSVEEVKEEKESDLEWVMKRIHKDKENLEAVFNSDQPKEEEQAIVGEQKDICGNSIVKDQPLTPKDVGWSKGRAMYEFEKWLWENDGTLMSYLTDEEFDRLFQEFLKEKKGEI